MLADFHSGMNDAVGHSTPEQLLEEALAAHRRGSIGDAKRLYASVLSIDPANAAAYGNLAIIAAQQGDLAGAERLFRQEIKLRPDDPAGYNNLGSVLQRQARFADAIVAHRQAIKLNPEHSSAHINLGAALSAKNEWDLAIAEYRLAAAMRELDPSEVGLEQALENLNARLGEHRRSDAKAPRGRRPQARPRPSG